MKHAIRMIYMIMRVMNCKGLEVKFLARINVLDKIWTVLLKAKQIRKKLSDAIVTVRNERNVIPVKAEYRQDFNGIVHDQSASGQTLYIEPSSVVEMNNQISRLRHDEAIEKERILTQLTGYVAADKDALLVAEQVMGQLDF